MSEQDLFLQEALQKAVAMVDGIDGRYREAAFPVILQALIKPAASANGDEQNQVTTQQETTESKLPPTMSVNEFFRRAKPESHPERFVCAAYYLFHTGKAEQITYADIQDIYGKLRIPKPKNPSDVISQCVRKAHLVDADPTPDKQKTWAITPDGEQCVEDLLNAHSNSSKSAS